MLNPIYVKAINMDDKTKNFIFYEQGQYSKPLFILTQIELLHLTEQIKKALTTGG